MIQVEIPKELYDRIDKFAVVEKAIISEMTEWVEIMEDEERIEREIESSTVRFRVNTYFEMERVPYCIVEAVKKQDKDSDFVGKIDIGSKEKLLKIAEKGWGILPEEIEFVEG